MRFAVTAAMVAAVGLGVVLGGRGLTAAPAPKGAAATIGYVDLAQVTEQIKETAAWKVLVEKFQADQQRYQVELEQLTKIRYLTPAERTQLDNLRAKKTPSAAEQTQIRDLEGKSDKLDAEYQTLAQTEKLTDEQSKRHKELLALREAAVQAVRGEADKRAEELRKLEQEALNQMQVKVLKTCGDVAASKDLAIVLDKQAVLAGGTDLTQDILQKVGPKK